MIIFQLVVLPSRPNIFVLLPANPPLPTPACTLTLIPPSHVLKSTHEIQHESSPAPAPPVAWAAVSPPSHRRCVPTIVSLSPHNGMGPH
ncbi:MAG: hypothetical protein ACTSPV_19890 [Candidatus Hodarchaeales archaeon]